MARETTPAAVNRPERIIAYMVASAIGLSLIAFLAVILAPLFGPVDYGSGAWPTITVLPVIGLPIGFILIVILLVTSAVRRSRNAKDAGR